MDYRWTRWLSLVTNTLISYWSPSWKSRLTFWPGFWPITSAVKLLSPRLSCWAELFALLYNLYRQVNTHLSLKFLTCNLQRYEHFWLITKTSVKYRYINFLLSIPDSLSFLPLILYMGGKWCITMSFSTIYIYTAELFPTNLRHSLLGICSMTGRMGSILSPQTPLLVSRLPQECTSRRPIRTACWLFAYYFKQYGKDSPICLYIPFIFCVTLFMLHCEIVTLIIDWLSSI